MRTIPKITLEVTEEEVITLIAALQRYQRSDDVSIMPWTIRQQCHRLLAYIGAACSRVQQLNQNEKENTQ